MTLFPKKTFKIIAVGETSPDLQTAVAYLRQEGHHVYHSAPDPRLLEDIKPDVILLGPLPPGASYREVAAAWRARFTPGAACLLALGYPAEEPPPQDGGVAAADVDEVIETPVTLAGVRRRIQTIARLLAAAPISPELDNALPCALIFVDEAGRIFRCNDAAGAILNRPAGELYGRIWAELSLPLVDANGQPATLADFPPLLGHESTSETTLDTIGLRQGDGRLRWCRFSVRPLRQPDSPDHHGFVIMLIDITESILAEEALQASEARYRQIFETNQAVKLVIDPEDGRILAANQAAADFYGYGRNVLTSLTISDLNTLPEEAVKAEMQSAKHQKRLSFNFRHRLASGELRDVEVYSGPVEVQGEKLLYSIIHDVTERRKAEAALRENEQVLRQQLDLSLATQTAEGLASVISLCLDSILSVSGMDTAVFQLYDDNPATKPQLFAATRLPEHQSALISYKNYPHHQLRLAGPGPIYYRHNSIPPASIPRSADSQPVTPAQPLTVVDMLLHHKGRPIGHLNLGSFQLQNVPEAARMALETTINQISGIIAHAQTEQKLLHLSRAVEQSPVSIVITDLEGTIQYINPKFSEITGYQPADILGQKPSILKSGHTTAQEYHILWETICSGETWHGEFCNLKKNGELYWESAQISPIKNSEGETTHFLAVKEDITIHKQMLTEIEQRNKEMQLLNRASWTISASLDMDQVLVTMVHEARRLLNAPACSVWLPETAANELVCQQMVDANGRMTDGWRLPLGQGLAGWVALHGQTLNVPDAPADDRHLPELDARTGVQVRSVLTVPLLARQVVIGVFQLVDGVANRFNERDQHVMESLAAVAANALENARLHKNLQEQYQTLKQTQTRLIQSEKLAAIGEIVSGVAHELNNPLAATVLYAQLLQRKGIDTDYQRDLDQLATQARRASNIVRGLLDFARQRPPERRKTLVNDVILTTLELLAYELRTHNIKVYTQLAEDIPAILADPHQLQQVFVNLVNNASQAMVAARDGGHLTITTAIAHSTNLNTGLLSVRPVVRITLQDDGPGIPEALQTRIFDPFFTTKGEGQGTGLGLSVCHGIVSEHGGDIWVESREEQGATFFVELPLTPPQETAVAAPAVEVEPDSNKNPSVSRRILVIDDEPSLVQVVARVLRRHEYLVETAENGAEALDHLAQTHFDLILSDLRMPGMNGLELYERVGAEYPWLQQRLIFTTGDTLNASTRQFLKKNNLHFLAKPFDIKDLLARIQSLLAAD